jgi:hypothetical protein
VVFPYSTFEAAAADKFAKLGGVEEAFRFLVNGYKTTFWRKGSTERRQDKIKRALELMKKYEAKNPESKQAERR